MTKMTNIAFKKGTTNQEISILASEALKARLYVAGWLLSGILQKLKHQTINDDAVRSIVVAYLNDIPVGVCVSRRWRRYRNPFLIIFVRKKYRRLGIGRGLVKRIMETKKGFDYCGTKDGLKFFNQFQHSRIKYY